MSLGTHLTLLVGSSVFSFKVWYAILDAAANLAVMITIGSGVLAGISWLQYNRTTADIADAAGLGVAIGFWPGIAWATYVFFHATQDGFK